MKQNKKNIEDERKINKAISSGFIASIGTSSAALLAANAGKGNLAGKSDEHVKKIFENYKQHSSKNLSDVSLIRSETTGPAFGTTKPSPFDGGGRKVVNMPKNSYKGLQSD